MMNRIRKLRRELDLTQSEFASRIGTTANVLTNYETGRRNPSSSVINNICKTFNVNESWLRTGDGDMFVASPGSAIDALAAEYNLTPGDRALLEKFINLKADQRAAIIDFVVQVAAAFQEDDAPQLSRSTDLSDLSIDDKVELYRRELEREEKVEENS